MSTLADFLMERLVEDQAAATTAVPCSSAHPSADMQCAVLHQRVDRRAKAEVQAKLKIVANAVQYRRSAEAETVPSRRFIADIMVETADDAMKAIGTVYADHPDYQDSWRP